MPGKTLSNARNSTTPSSTPSSAVASVTLAGEAAPCLGIGTWKMGEHRSRRRQEVAALQLAIDLGMSLIDTAEMYADGGAEEVVGEALTGRRDRVFLVSKVYPHNATRDGTAAACERSLRRLHVDAIDLYLLHWRGSVALQETIEAMSRLVDAGKIRHWGVSNFEVDDLRELAGLQQGNACATDQVLYNLLRRGIEWDLLPWCRRHQIRLMAYSPLDQGRLARHRRLAKLAAALGVPPTSVALAWVLRNRDVIAIPKATSPEHVRTNRAALDLVLEAPTLAEIEAAFPPPDGPSPLAIV